MKKSLTGAAAGLALALGLGLAAPAHAATTTDIKPGTLERGDAGYVPHVDGDDLVVAGRHYDFDGYEVRFLGYAGEQHNEYVVGIYKQGKPASHQVVRVTPDDERTVVLEGVSVPEIVSSEDGTQLYRPWYRYKKKITVMKVWSGEDGTLQQTRRFKGSVDVLDAFEGRAVLSSFAPMRTFWWDTTDDTTTLITRRDGYEASIRQNRLAAVDGDPYLDGCSIVSKLTRPGHRYWRSCEQAVVEFSPSGSRAVTTHLLADGLGPGTYEIHEIGGKLVHRFTTYFFGEVWWEADEVLLMHAYGKTKNSWVRCWDDGDCERTSKLRNTHA